MEKKPNINISLLNIDFEIPKQNKSFLSIFTFLRKKLQIKSSRKNHIDSLLKKSKGKFFKAVFEGIKICLNLRIKRLPQKFITNITIEYNQQFFYKKIIEIYNQFEIIPSLNDIIEKNLYKKGKLEIFKEFVSNDFISLYFIYVESDRFIRDINNIKMEEGKRIGILYEFVARNFVVYYLERKDKKNQHKKIIFKISNK